MYPKNSNILYKQIAKKLNCDETLVSDLIHYVFNELRNNMSNMNDIIYSLPYIGKFEATTPLIRKELKRFYKILKEKPVIAGGAEKMKLVRAMQMSIDEALKFNESKLNKLLWHKENGDPYKKYNKEQEENLRRYIEYLKEKEERRDYIIKTYENL